ncbi:polymorphic toxin-type HINT domain-containing protein [Aliiroseovarius sp. 2305UL8-7]|uniref:polymorphic toxin-type HINT domain-containing protein n=1 Tax=Aliiroseovarius conchicola TaxID=3121637 RepID=UPI003528E64D
MRKEAAPTGFWELSPNGFVLGVTTAHPVFVQGAGWIFAGDLTPGDAIRDKDLEPLTVISITQDDTPQLVYNFEVAEAHKDVCVMGRVL